MCKELWTAVPCSSVQQGLCSRTGEVDWYYCHQHAIPYLKELRNFYICILGPKNDPPTDLQEKVLTLIQSWSDAFQQYPELQGVTQVYQELKSKGIEFPMTNMDLMAPILTPQKVFVQICGEIVISFPSI